MPPPPSSNSVVIHFFGLAFFLAEYCLKISDDMVTVGWNITWPTSTVMFLFLFTASHNRIAPDENPFLPLLSYP